MTLYIHIYWRSVRARREASCEQSNYLWPNWHLQSSPVPFVVSRGGGTHMASNRLNIQTRHPHPELRSVILTNPLREILTTHPRPARILAVASHPHPGLQVALTSLCPALSISSSQHLNPEDTTNTHNSTLHLAAALRFAVPEPPLFGIRYGNDTRTMRQ